MHEWPGIEFHARPGLTSSHYNESYWNPSHATHRPRLSGRRFDHTQSVYPANRLSGRSQPASAALADAANPGSAMMMRAVNSVVPATLPVEGEIPSLAGAVQWLNSPPLTAQSLRGKVVLLDIWTYSCINCLRTLPYVKAWADKYRDQGLVVIGVHAPEFAFEYKVDNVKRAIHNLGIDYPVAIDNNFAIWRALGNEYWPADYLIDAEGRIRAHHFGEGDYAQAEQQVRQLLAEAGSKQVATALVNTSADGGAQLAQDAADMHSPETYIGYSRTEHFASPGGEVNDKPAIYHAPLNPILNQWGLAGAWQVGQEFATLNRASGRIVYRFHSRDLHLVLGPGADGKPVRFRVTIDGMPPAQDHGSDVAGDGSGTVTEQRLYQLVRQNGKIADRTFTIEFLDPGVQAYSFTFG